jgi:hypothetical protein
MAQRWGHSSAHSIGGYWSPRFREDDNSSHLIAQSIGDPHGCE